MIFKVISSLLNLTRVRQNLKFLKRKNHIEKKLEIFNENFFAKLGFLWGVGDKGMFLELNFSPDDINVEVIFHLQIVVLKQNLKIQK